jgi:hypothetical protein
MSDSSSGQTPPPESLIDYPALVDRALRQVVRLALEQADGGELPGQHYFYISFSTQFPGVVMDDDLRAMHPETLSIVLQYQFENLKVGINHFEVTLYFGGEAKHLSVPYDAVLGFVDPYISFALQFPPLDEDGAVEGERLQDLEDASQARPSYLRALSDYEAAASEEVRDPAPATAKPKKSTKAKKADKSGAPVSAQASAEGNDEASDGAKPDDGSNVVSLDQFRKK